MAATRCYGAAHLHMHPFSCHCAWRIVASAPSGATHPAQVLVWLKIPPTIVRDKCLDSRVELIKRLFQAADSQGSASSSRGGPNGSKS